MSNRRSSSLSDNVDISKEFYRNAVYKHFDYNTDVPEALTFHPTEAEFCNPIEYIKKIAPIAQPYGICKIVPPEECSLPTSLSSLTSSLTEKQFRFTTKIQNIDKLQCRNDNNRAKDYNSVLPKSKRIKLDLNKPNDLLEEEQEQQEEEFGFERIEDETSLKSFKKMADGFKSTFFQASSQSQNIQLDACAFKEAIIVSTPSPNKTRRKKKRRSEGSSSPLASPPPQPSPPQPSLHSVTNQPVNSSFVLTQHQSQHDTARNHSIHLPKVVLRKLARQAGVKRVRGVVYYTSNQDVTNTDIEGEYWNTVDCDKSSRRVTVLYGSDLDCTKVGSCFPRTWQYGWNMNKLAILNDSVLKYLYQTIPGITSPMLYVGMLFSSFCWHVEDNHLCAINYIHSGANKTWYAIPGDAAANFESVMKENLSGLFQDQPNLLHHMITMLSPRVAQKHNVPIYRMSHEAGTFYCNLFPELIMLDSTMDSTLQRASTSLLVPGFHMEGYA
ncbi:hypothetical protein AKO1_009250 [Acrasis kona]|uniref:JmjC domain-containing protein n=1 Tax=Acrasis kona TaxID=1008807 RepID=A0AAW2ZJ21_9EUKA